MNICPNCGVELDKDLIKCPLCGITNGGDGNTEKEQDSEYYPSDIILLHRKETQRHLFEFLGIISVSGIAVCSIVDMVTGKSLSWSLFTSVSILTAWISVSLLLLAFRKYYIVIPGLLIAVLFMLFLFDLILPPLSWFFSIALPITLTLFVSVSIVTVLWNIARLKGFNILAFSFIILSLFCIVSELFIDKYLYGSVSIGWSAIVAVSIFPISLILLFVHYRMKKGKRLDSYFHV